MLIPSSVVRGCTGLSWNDITWGYKHQMLGWSAPVELAVDRLIAGSNDPLEVELAGLQKSEAHQVGELLQRLALREGPADDVLSKRKWLYLNLCWLFNNRKNVLDPLGEIEVLYADFDYPSEIKNFIGYMPATDGYNPGQHSMAENEQRLFERWKQYLLRTEHQLGVSCSST
jgi:hypothetical protein